jgi:hypothetical protein
MVGQGDPHPAKTTEEIQWEVEEEMARAAHLAMELNKRKGHNGLQDDSGAPEDEPGDGAPSRRHHPKFNSWHCADRVWLWDRSRSIHEEINRIKYPGK